MKFDNILIVSDIDGTLAHNCMISDANLRAIKYFKENGGKFTVATGRTPAYVMEKYSGLTNAPIVTVNGSIIVDNNMNVLRSRPLFDGYERIVDYAKRICSFQRIQLYTVNDTVFYDDADKNEAYGKILFVTENEADAITLRTNLTAEFGNEYIICRSWDTGVEVNSINASKGSCIEFLKKHTHTDIAIGIGDYENDISLVKEADIGVAVFNATDELKQNADYVIGQCKEDSIAYLINEGISLYCRL